MNIHRSVERRSKYGFIVGRYHIAHAGSDAGAHYKCTPNVVGNQLVHPKPPTIITRPNNEMSEGSRKIRSR